MLLCVSLTFQAITLVLSLTLLCMLKKSQILDFVIIPKLQPLFSVFPNHTKRRCSSKRAILELPWHFILLARLFIGKQLPFFKQEQRTSYAVDYSTGDNIWRCTRITGDKNPTLTAHFVFLGIALYSLDVFVVFWVFLAWAAIEKETCWTFTSRCTWITDGT